MANRTTAAQRHNARQDKIWETSQAIAARRYVGDILSGLVPSDPLYDPIYEAVAAHGGCALTQVCNQDMIAMAGAIRQIRA